MIHAYDAAHTGDTTLAESLGDSVTDRDNIFEKEGTKFVFR